MPYMIGESEAHKKFAKLTQIERLVPYPKSAYSEEYKSFEDFKKRKESRSNNISN